jgi:hypothetical protein
MSGLKKRREYSVRPVVFQKLRAAGPWGVANVFRKRAGCGDARATEVCNLALFAAK